MESENYAIKDLIKALSSTLQMVAIYTNQHPRAKTAIEKLYAGFSGIFTTLEEVHIGVVGSELFSGTQIFFELTTQVKDFILVLQEKQIEFIRFKRGLSQDELSNFVTKLSVRNKEGDADFVETFINQAQFSHIQIGKFGQEVQSSPAVQESSFKKELPEVNMLYQQQLSNVTSALEKGADDLQLDYSVFLSTAVQLFRLSMQHQHALFILSGVKKHDDYTFVHCVNTSLLTMFQARILGIPEKDVVKLGVAGFLHDIGKIAIKRALLDKKGKLSQGEFLQIKNHAVFGAKILLRGSAAERIPLIVAFGHHLGCSLQGYPKTRFLQNQHLASQLVSLSDVYDALRSRRSYRGSMSLERVYEIMKKEEGRLFDPFLLDLFFKHLGVWPVGTLVMLDSQEIALVKMNNPRDIFRPQVEIFFDAQGNKLDEGVVIDMTEKDSQGNFKRRIQRHLSAEGEGRKFVVTLFGEI